MEQDEYKSDYQPVVNPLPVEGQPMVVQPMVQPMVVPMVQGQVVQPMVQGKVIAQQPTAQPVSGQLVQPMGAVATPMPYNGKVMPVVQVHGVAAAQPGGPGFWRGGSGCDCCAPPGGCCLCLATVCCACVVIGQLHDRVIQRGSCTSVALVIGVVIFLMEVVDIIDGILMMGLDLSGVTWLLEAAVIYYYLSKIRAKIVARDNIVPDRPAVCNCGGGVGCDTFFCHPCVTCWIFRHELQVQSQGQEYTQLCTPSGTNHPLVMAV